MVVKNKGRNLFGAHTKECEKMSKNQKSFTFTLHIGCPNILSIKYSLVSLNCSIKISPYEFYNTFKIRNKKENPVSLCWYECIYACRLQLNSYIFWCGNLKFEDTYLQFLGKIAYIHVCIYCTRHKGTIPTIKGDNLLIYYDRLVLRRNYISSLLAVRLLFW